MIRMDEFNKIRKSYFIDNLSINEIADKFNRSWATVNKIVNTSRDECSEMTRKFNGTPKVATQEVMDAIADKLQEEQLLKVKKKQRVTATVIFEELTAKGIYQGSRRRMQELVKIMRQKLSQNQPDSFLPLEFPPGSTAQIDHGEVECVIDKERRTCFLFVLAVPGTGLRYCQLFATKSQEAWGEFHERSFRFFKGIFNRTIYDNDTVLVKYLKEKRMLTNFALHLVEHYGFEITFCNPASGNEKGSVENNVGFCRRNYLHGCPVFEDTRHANTYLDHKCREAIENGAHFKLGTPLPTILVEVAANLTPLLPSKNWRSWMQRKVNAYQQINIDNHCYSVPEKYVMTSLKVGVGAESIDIFDGDALIVSHKRQFALGKDSLILDHYLDQLSRKPGALWDCKAINEVAADEMFLLLWKQLMSRTPALQDENIKLRAAQKDFIDVLRLKRNFSINQLRDGIKKAIECGSYISAASIECIIRGIQNPYQPANEVFKRIDLHKWECDVSLYSSLLQEEVLC